MADKIEDRIIVVFIIQGIIRFQDRCLAEIALEGSKKITRQVIEIGVFGAIEYSPSRSGKIECGFFIDGKNVVQAQILDVIGQVGIFEKVGIRSFCEERDTREILVHVKAQVGELISFGKVVLEQIAGHVLGKR